MFVVRGPDVTVWLPSKDHLQQLTTIIYARGVQPLAVAGRITFIYMKYGRQ